jgi:hypothetical protein
MDAFPNANFTAKLTTRANPRSIFEAVFSNMAGKSSPQMVNADDRK